MRFRIPLAITFIAGMGLIVQFFVPHPVSSRIYQEALIWYEIIYIFMLVLAVRSLCVSHIRKIKRRQIGWSYSIITLGSLFTVACIGIFGGVGTGTTLTQIYNYVQTPLESTLFALLAFFMASAAYRAFKARTKEAALLLVIALIVMFGRVPVGERLVPKMPDIVEWILIVPNMAAQRGILIGVGLGMIATSLKIILGIERQYLGGK